MIGTNTNDKANRFAIAKSVASHNRRMWVSQRQYDEYLTSNQFTDGEMKSFVIVEPVARTPILSAKERENNENQLPRYRDFHSRSLEGPLHGWTISVQSKGFCQGRQPSRRRACARRACRKPDAYGGG